MTQDIHARGPPEIVLTDDRDHGWGLEMTEAGGFRGHLVGSRVTPVLTSGTPAIIVARLEGTGLYVKEKCPHEGSHGYYFRGRNRMHSCG